MSIRVRQWVRGKQFQETQEAKVCSLFIFYTIFAPRLLVQLLSPIVAPNVTYVTI